MGKKILGEKEVAIAKLFEKLHVIAINGLQNMYLDDEDIFCHQAVKSNKSLLLKGVSPRYSAMSVIGVCENQTISGENVEWPIHKVCNQLIEWVTLQGAEVGDSGLVLWALLKAKHPDSHLVVKSLIERRARVEKQHYMLTTMSLGYLLAGLSEALQMGVETRDCLHLAETVFKALIKRQSNASNLFPLGGYVSQHKILTRFSRMQLGSFASQVYPIVGLSMYSKFSQNEVALTSAEKALDAVCRLQGPEGQWWWIYNIKRGNVAVQYPVYSIHQDAMGPMAICAVKKAGGRLRNEALLKSFQWLAKRLELPSESLIDTKNSVVWRAIQRDDPSKTGGFGLGLYERLRMLAISLTGTKDNRKFKSGWVCDECRPYHLGWILLAEAWYRELSGDRI